MSTAPIRHISDTALWVAIYRANESDRADAVFRDPYARKLAGERGAEIAAAMPFAQKHSWSYVARTWLVDQIVEREVNSGTDMVIDLAAGLDSRPYRMKLPASVKWVDIDLPDVLKYKQQILAGERTQCAYEQVALDLTDIPARRAVFQRLGSQAKRALVITEGLIIYFDESGAGELARDLAAQASFQHWATDLTSPALLKMLQKAIGGVLNQSGSPLRFAPRQGPEFFTPFGWRGVEARSLLITAAKLKRLSFGMRFLALFPDPGGRKPDKPWGGVCVLENIASPER